MRTIKFRGKRVDNGDWVYGFIFIGKKTWILRQKPPHEKEESGLQPFKPVEVIPESVGQYIGMEDKNKVEIYEGSIIEIKTKEWDSEEEKNYWKKEIVWVKVSNLGYVKAFFDLEAKKMWNNGYSYEDYSDEWENNENIKVIGNIHDNPDLTK